MEVCDLSVCQQDEKKKQTSRISWNVVVNLDKGKNPFNFSERSTLSSVMNGLQFLKLCHQSKDMGITFILPAQKDKSTMVKCKQQQKQLHYNS